MIHPIETNIALNEGFRMIYDSLVLNQAEKSYRRSKLADAQPATLNWPVPVSSMGENDLKQQIDTLIRSYPDFPSKGVLFRDVLPLFSKPTLVRSLCCYVANRYRDKIDLVAGLEARGFLFGPIIALELGIPFVPVRKQGKLPGPVISASYQKEYGKDVFEVQQDALLAGQRVLIVDDLLATGGSLRAAEQLVKQTGATVYANFVVIELGDLKGRKVLGSEVDAFLTY